MKLSELEIKNTYVGKGKIILNDFLLPLLSETNQYDRITGYYTIESLLAISQGVESLFEKKGKMRLLIGIHSFPEEMVEACLAVENMQTEINRIRKEIKSKIVSLKEVIEKKRLATLAWMINDGLLEVKAVSVRGNGIFHSKTLIFTGTEGEQVAAVGSANETGNGLGGNFEQVVVLKSWEAKTAVNEQINFFNALWENKMDDAISLDITEDTANLILDGLGKEYADKNAFEEKDNLCKNIIRKSAEMPVNFFVSGNIPALYMHQERAVIDALSRWPVRVMFSDEVGLGKTFEVAATVTFLIKYCSVKRVVILTPKSVLKQWQDELSTHFGLEMWLYDSAAKAYFSPSGEKKEMGRKNPLCASAPDLILMSAQYARGSKKNGSVFEKSSAILPDLLVLDEAHSARISQDISGSKKKTQMYKIMEKIAADIPHMILATATPMQKEADEYHAMLKLLGLPKIWCKGRIYNKSLQLISKNEKPDRTDAVAALNLIKATLKDMQPSKKWLDDEEKQILDELFQVTDLNDNLDKAELVQEHWNVIRRIFIKLHPAKLLTIRNTRKSLEKVGYIFPKRNLIESNVYNSEVIELFYEEVNDYIQDMCFSVEGAIDPEKKINTGFMKISYQQRVASSLYSCKESLIRRYQKVLELEEKILRNVQFNQKEVLTVDEYIDDINDDELLNADKDSLHWAEEEKLSDKIDITALKRCISLEKTALNSLIIRAEELMKTVGDMKINKSMDLAVECLKNEDIILIFSRYTDTIDALLEEYKKRGLENHFDYGIYTGKKSVIIHRGKEKECTKDDIKRELFSRKIQVVFCSDAASEGLNLQAARVLINVDVPWTPARLEQRIGRIARLGQKADEVDVYNVWYPNSIEARMYQRIQKRLEESNLAIGEFPEVVAQKIKESILEDTEEDISMKELKEIRNSYQTKALEELWSAQNEKMTTSDFVRMKLMDFCDETYNCLDDNLKSGIKGYLMPNGKTEYFTAETGNKESMTLKSTPWRYKDFNLSGIETYEDYEGNLAAFYFKENQKEIIKHESIFNGIGNDPKYDVECINVNEWPKMLADQNELNLEYAVERQVGEAPKLWPPVVG